MKNLKKYELKKERIDMTLIKLKEMIKKLKLVDGSINTEIHDSIGKGYLKVCKNFQMLFFQYITTEYILILIKTIFVFDIKLN